LKLAKISLAIITSLVLMVSVCLPVQASEESGEVDLEATGALTISEVSASSIGYYGATISWKTNGDATSQVFYDTEFHDNIDDYAYHTDVDTDLVTEHSIRLTELSLGTTYHYRVRSAIPDTEFIDTSVEDDTFKTSSPAPPPPPPPPAPTIETNLFGTEGSYPISSTGEILETIEGISEDGMLPITLPKGTIALDKDGELLGSLAVTIDETPPDPPESAYIIGLAYNFEPDGATFDPGITFEYTYDPETLPEGVDEEDLVIAFYDAEAGEWVTCDCTCDPEANCITACVCHFTTFAIIAVPVVAPPAPAAFSVSSLSIQPAEVEPAEAVTIAVSVANTGGESGSYTVVLKIDGLKEAEKTVTIAAGDSQDVSFSVTREEADSYTVTVDGLSGSFTVAPVVVPPEPAAFSVSYLSVSPRLEVEPGETVTITVMVANTGGESGSYTVVLKIDGVKEAEETVTLTAGDSQDVSFSVTREDPGDYTVDVDGLSGSFTVVLPIKPPGINWAMIGGIIGGVIVVGLLIFFLILRRRTYTRL